MEFLNTMIRWGIPTLFKTINIDLPATAKIDNLVGSKMPEDIGRIFGLSITVGTVDADNTTLITAANATNLYLVLKKGQTAFVDRIRLDSLIFNNASGTYQADARFLPVNISKNISLDQSIIKNPTSITGVRILLNMWYITPDKYDRLIEKGYIVDTNLSG